MLLRYQKNMTLQTISFSSGKDYYDRYNKYDDQENNREEE